MKTLLLACALSIVTLLSSTKATASHALGGELTYRCIGGFDYEFTLTIYSTCGLMNTGPQFINMYSSCGGSSSFNLTFVSATNLSLSCNILLQCNDPLAFGKSVLKGTVTLPGACSDYTFWWTACCRNSSVVNLVALNDVYIYANLDNTIATVNSSPVFTNKPIVCLFAGQNYHLNNGMYDVDGDSLAMRLVAPPANFQPGIPFINTSTNYNPPYTYFNPISSVTPFALDASTGEMVVTPLNIGGYVCTYQIDEYRNGTKIGSSTRDELILTIPSTDQLPELSGINNLPVFTTNVCAGDSLRFDIYSKDVDATDSTAITWSFFGQPNAALTVNQGQHESGTFSWATDSSMISSNPYLLYVSVKDNACPYYGIQTYVYKIYVNECITNDVWPGDANSDFTCEIDDILPIGIAYGATDPARPGASLAWVAQPASPWAVNLNGVNFKHADCDGNGVVDLLDLTAITLNFGNAHNKNGAFTNPYINGLPDLFVSFSASVAAPGTPVVATINLGSASIPMTDIYGITYSLNYDQNMFQQGSVNFNNNTNFIGNASNSISMIQGIPDYGNLKSGIVRIDHNNVQGSGEIGKLNFIANPLIQGDVTFNMSFNSVKIITNTGEVIPINVVNQNEITISQTLATTEIGKDISNFIIRPNQVTDNLVIDYTLARTSDVSIVIFDMVGNKTKTIMLNNQSSGLHAYTMNVADFAKGTYLVRLISSNGISTQKMIKL